MIHSWKLFCLNRDLVGKWDCRVIQRFVCNNHYSVLNSKYGITLQVYKNEVDFFPEEYDLLKLKEENGVYPPRFCVVITCTPTAIQSQARIEFRGAVDNPVFDISLNPLPMSPLSPRSMSIGSFFS